MTKKIWKNNKYIFSSRNIRMQDNNNTASKSKNHWIYQKVQQKEQHPKNITTNAVAPGFIQTTDMTNVLKR